MAKDAVGATVRFEAPPPSRRGRWQRFASGLQEYPGEWVRVDDEGLERFGYDRARQIGRSLRAAGVDVTYRSYGSEVGVWARWPTEGVS